MTDPAETEAAGAGREDGAGAVLDRDGLEALVRVLARRGRTVVGPTVRDGAIVLDELDSAGALPWGWGVELEAGRYRLRRREDGAAFAHSAGPQSWKTFLHPERVRQWTADREPDGGMTVREDRPRDVAYAFLGVRPCDLRAIRVLDRVMTGGRHRDPAYRSRRAGAFLIAVECTEPGATCFCVSMGSGPAVDAGYDLALTEVVDGEGHRFLCRSGSAEGAEVLAELPRRTADGTTRRAAADAVRDAADRMGRSMPPVDLRTLMRDNLEAERWDDVTARCLSCGNCTMVCPTCFCTTTEDVTDLTGDHAERWRRWDSCYDLDFSLLGGGPVRASPRSRYRQWLTHKLGTWHDQFGSSGCVGCGRCIVWCPTGIDLTEEAHALHEEATRKEGRT
ncbi:MULTISPECIES: 4Fe-4S dicluster domain-containing protein [unclassified Streptomyces]|uniref:4Fe-4S dicluster domain-containing protein n=1 Tax=unclassified Streptomyces TaxID=2593676 RepID=UPI0022B6B1BA|nr:MULTISPECIES: 4Fe-4S dicluster domain-containing protein [unclassified Streptomyces]MCZ7417732.1 4Fe-4S dicluster domain-containing protein [Streptomyces sp. WMMC897]MCZ7432472.1 4Fe-4S dicluster domain-containing protein [Streptomyces sp. WMMC1477]